MAKIRKYTPGGKWGKVIAEELIGRLSWSVKNDRRINCTFQFGQFIITLERSEIQELYDKTMEK